VIGMGVGIVREERGSGGAIRSHGVIVLVKWVLM